MTLGIEQVEYDHCISPSLTLFNYGGFTTSTFNITDTYYVICVEQSHCQAGQKIKIKIDAPEPESSILASPSPSPSPSFVK